MKNMEYIIQIIQFKLSSVKEEGAFNVSNSNVL